ncbi:MAG: LysR substrate-binding domain-containing protein [Thalassospira sp.]|uniref:LysR substrate-binding domain-containing protein n=1 Tax=Thalassospira sp. TaxID=1912094 RepID=UPI0032ED9111
MVSYPPLKSLPAFEAALRLNSFTLAAEELNVTPGAVGQQIRKLEEWLGVDLFTRATRQVYPTADGLAYAARIGPALQQIADASGYLRRRNDTSVHFAMPPSFAAKWFSPRMAKFLIMHPTTALHVGSTEEKPNFEHDGLDIAVRYFNGNDDGLEAVLLYRGQAAVFCAPSYRDQLGLKTPPDLVRATLINDTKHHWWADWLATYAGVTREETQTLKHIDIDQTAMVIEAAIHNQGVVIANPLLAEEDVNEGKLVHLFPEHVLTVPLGYYLVHPKNRELRSQVRLFRDWLLDEARDLVKRQVF